MAQAEGQDRQPAYFGVRQAADYLGFTERTIRKLITEGRLPAYRLNREIRIKPRDLDRLLQPIAAGGESA